MSDLVEFANRVKEQLSASVHEPHWAPAEAELYMAQVAERRLRFEKLSACLVESIIQPRFETLVGHFTNAIRVKDEPRYMCSYWFGYCERFPVSAKVAFAVEHDISIEQIAVCYELSMMPVFIKLPSQDKLISLINAIDDEAVASWVEQKLLEFLKVYQQIDRGGDDFQDESVTDPVCGMRISRSVAASSESYRGHPYFFCSRDCQERFALDPTAYVDVRAM